MPMKMRFVSGDIHIPSFDVLISSLVIHCGAGMSAAVWFIRAADRFSVRATDIARIVGSHATQGVQRE
ncbi:hypothetical protein BURKHO8Y_110240 [Burkholderia sp. 8Y]|nr:hypothetical protein BURKHO8Y_110240 [Burkholderia sp. 8Y]